MLSVTVNDFVISLREQLDGQDSLDLDVIKLIGDELKGDEIEYEIETDVWILIL